MPQQGPPRQVMVKANVYPYPDTLPGAPRLAAVVPRSHIPGLRISHGGAGSLEVALGINLPAAQHKLLYQDMDFLAKRG